MDAIEGYVERCSGERKDWAPITTAALKTISGKWKIIILSEMFVARRPVRFSELERRIGDVTQKMLIQQLKELQADGLIDRVAYPEVPPRVEYNLTELGLALGPAVEQLIDWAFAHHSAPRHKADNDHGR